MLKTKLLFDIISDNVIIKKNSSIFVNITFSKKDELFFVNIFKDENVKIPIARLSYTSLKNIIKDFPHLKTKINQNDFKVALESRLFSLKVSSCYEQVDNIPIDESLFDIIMSTMKVTTRRWKSGNFSFIQFQLPSMSHVQFKLTDKDHDKLVKLVSFKDLKDKNAF